MTRTLLADKALLTKSTPLLPMRALGAAACLAGCFLACGVANAAGSTAAPAPRPGAAMETVLTFKNPEPAPTSMDVAPPGGVPMPSRDRFGQPVRTLTPQPASVPHAASAASPGQAEGLPPLPTAASGAVASATAASGADAAGKPVAVFGTMEAAAQAGVDPLQRKAQVVSKAEPAMEPTVESWRPAWLLELGATLRGLERMTVAQWLELARAHPPVSVALACVLAALAALAGLGLRSALRSREARR